MSATVHPFERELLPLVAFQGTFFTLAGFGALLVYAEGGMAPSVQYTAWMPFFAMLATFSPFVVGRPAGPVLVAHPGLEAHGRARIGARPSLVAPRRVSCPAWALYPCFMRGLRVCRPVLASWVT